jgi:hypothetical protein
MQENDEVVASHEETHRGALKELSAVTASQLVDMRAEYEAAMKAAAVKEGEARAGLVAQMAAMQAAFDKRPARPEDLQLIADLEVTIGWTGAG